MMVEAKAKTEASDGGDAAQTHTLKATKNGSLTVLASERDRGTRRGKARRMLCELRMSD